VYSMRAPPAEVAARQTAGSRSANVGGISPRAGGLPGADGVGLQVQPSPRRLPLAPGIGRLQPVDRATPPARTHARHCKFELSAVIYPFRDTPRRRRVEGTLAEQVVSGTSHTPSTSTAPQRKPRAPPALS